MVVSGERSAVVFVSGDGLIGPCMIASPFNFVNVSVYVVKNGQPDDSHMGVLHASNM